MITKILIIGACGQIGSELTLALREKYGNNNVIAADIREGNASLMESGPFVILDATNKEAIENCVAQHEITDVYLMAAMLSATAEKNPQKGWDLNMTSLSHVLDLGRDQKIKKIFWPSSIAVFGPTTPKTNTPQRTVMEPSTVYGISKLAGERWCEYFFNKYNVDVRSIRYPGLISYKTLPGGGTTDYAVDIYHKAISDKAYESFLKEKTILPMMYMDDAIKATIDIMEAAPEKIKIRSSYNLAGVSFAPEDMEVAIQKYIPDFRLSYAPDFRQAIADSWPNSIDDTDAREDWGWKHQFELDDITETMLDNLQKVL
ncbi:NAD-dependent epimerase/dehydratase family protein [Zhouia sp. PK063]|uniref:NAD-dependent epimerase/dehydratase family protein n=1 Tax=Zhouia sp. PK063 TaxID=3373602 RepID=UPI0037AA2240